MVTGVLGAAREAAAAAMVAGLVTGGGEGAWAVAALVGGAEVKGWGVERG